MYFFYRFLSEWNFDFAYKIYSKIYLIFRDCHERSKLKSQNTEIQQNSKIWRTFLKTTATTVLICVKVVTRVVAVSQRNNRTPCSKKELIPAAHTHTHTIHTHSWWWGCNIGRQFSDGTNSKRTVRSSSFFLCLSHSVGIVGTFPECVCAQWSGRFLQLYNYNAASKHLVMPW